MAKIPFDIKFRPQIESGEYKVETRDGRTARIICWDRRGERPLVVLVQRLNGYDEGLFYYDNGLADGVGQEHDNDLFIVTPEPEMSEWELAIAKYRPPTDSKETIQRIAAELLALARKQLQPEIDAEIEKAYKNSDSIVYENGVLYGKAEALKDLPRWKKVGLNTGQTTLVIGYTGEEDKLYRNGYVISLPDLEKLPKED